MMDLHKHLRTISLTSGAGITLKILDPNQFGVVPKSSTTLNLISMLHEWLSATDKPGTAIPQCCLTLEKRLTLLTITF